MGGEGGEVRAVGRGDLVEGRVGDTGFGGGGGVLIADGTEKKGGGMGTSLIRINIETNWETFDFGGGVNSEGLKVFEGGEEGVWGRERFGVKKAKAVIWGWGVGRIVGVVGSTGVGGAGREAEAGGEKFVEFGIGEDPGGDWAKFGIWWGWLVKREKGRKMVAVGSGDGGATPDIGVRAGVYGVKRKNVKKETIKTGNRDD